MRIVQVYHVGDACALPRKRARMPALHACSKSRFTPPPANKAATHSNPPAACPYAKHANRKRSFVEKVGGGVAVAAACALLQCGNGRARNARHAAMSSPVQQRVLVHNNAQQNGGGIARHATQPEVLARPVSCQWLPMPTLQRATNPQPPTTHHHSGTVGAAACKGRKA